MKLMNAVARKASSGADKSQWGSQAALDASEQDQMAKDAKERDPSVSGQMADAAALTKEYECPHCKKTSSIEVESQPQDKPNSGSVFDNIDPAAAAKVAKTFR